MLKCKSTNPCEKKRSETFNSMTMMRLVDAKVLKKKSPNYMGKRLFPQGKLNGLKREKSINSMRIINTAGAAAAVPSLPIVM